MSEHSTDAQHASSTTSLWKIISMIISVGIITVLGLYGYHLSRTLSSPPSNTQIEEYEQAAVDWFHAEDQMKRSLGEALKLISAATDHPDTKIGQLRSDLDALVRLDPPQAPESLRPLTPQDGHEVDKAAIHELALTLTSEDLQRDTENLRAARETADENSRALGRRSAALSKKLAESPQ